jgi:hypothetical protein
MKQQLDGDSNLQVSDKLWSSLNGSPDRLLCSMNDGYQITQAGLGMRR